MIDPDKAPISLDDARKLVDLSETGNNRAATKLLEAITFANSVDLYAEKGRLTRRRHQSLNRFQIEPLVATLATDKIPNASSRPMSMIENAKKPANVTMHAVAQSEQVADKMHSTISQILPELKKLMGKQLQLAKFNPVCLQLDHLLQASSKETARRSDLLTKVLMVQGYQVLSGHVIRHAIELVKEVENNLLHKLSVFGAAESTFFVAMENISTHKSCKESDNVKAEGQIIDAHFRDEVVSGQHDLVSNVGI